MNVIVTKSDFVRWIKDGKVEFCKEKEIYTKVKKIIKKMFEEAATESPNSEDLITIKKLEDFVACREAVAGFLSGIAMTESLYLLNHASDLNLYEQAKRALDDIQ